MHESHIVCKRGYPLGRCIFPSYGSSNRRQKRPSVILSGPDEPKQGGGKGAQGDVENERNGKAGGSGEM